MVLFACWEDEMERDVQTGRREEGEDKSERFDNEFMVIQLTHLHKPFVFLAGGDVATKKKREERNILLKVFSLCIEDNYFDK